MSKQFKEELDLLIYDYTNDVEHLWGEEQAKCRQELKQQILTLFKSILPEEEHLAELVHKAYCKYQKEVKGKEYWTKGDYSLLTDEVKEIDRYTVRAVLDEITKKVEGEG